MFRQNKNLLASIFYALENKKSLHLIGLVSDGGLIHQAQSVDLSLKAVVV
jgi:bisphosphoglycerate-independent phosphoglycerate mutase (AlkP superfamily)